MYMPETRRIIEKYRNQRNEIKNQLHTNLDKINRNYVKKVRELRKEFRQCEKIVAKSQI